MAQHDYVISNGTGAAVRSDLNNALSAIVTQNSGSTEPTTTYAYQMWADTNAGVMKIRNGANSAWITLYQLDGEWTSIAFENGSAAAPSIYFKDSGTDTGFFSGGTDQVNIATAGTERVEWGTSEVVFNDAGNNYDFRVEGDTNANLLFVDASADAVGIGTSSVQSQLSVLGPVGTLNDSGGTLLLATDAAGTDVSGALGAGVTFAQRWQPFSGAVRVAGIYGVKGSATSNYGGSLAFYTQPVSGADMGERMRITATGNVGIGTTSPATPLHVNGNVTVSSGSGIYLGTGSEQYITSSGSAGSTSLVFQRWTGAYTESARIDSSGRLLVGTSSAPTGSSTQYAKLVVRGNTATSNESYLVLGRNSAASVDQPLGSIWFADNADGQFARIEALCDATPGASDFPGRLVFSTTADSGSSPVEHARITSAGYFKATSSASGVYSAVSPDSHQFYQTVGDYTTFHASASGTPYGIGIRYTSASPNGAGNEFLTCYDSGPTLRASIRSNGGLANFSANNANLSDRNAKKDISPAAGTWDCIKEWEIVNYRYKDQPDDADLNLGVIAQQVAESCPEVITVFEEAKDDQPEKLGVKEQQMYWMAIKALQEAQVRIEQLEAEVAALKAQ